MTNSPLPRDEPPYERLTLAPETMLLREVEQAARCHYADLDGPRQRAAVEAILDLFAGELLPEPIDDPPLGTTLCDLCWLTPESGLFARVEKSLLPGVEPRFELGADPGVCLEFALCRPCATRNWPVWEADVVTLVGRLRRGSPVAKDAAVDLERQFHTRGIRIGDDAYRECGYCRRSSRCVQGAGAAVCLRCMDAARAVFEREALAEAERLAGARRRRAEERDLPFPDAMRADAERIAAHLRARRAQVLGPPAEPPGRAPDDARWDEMRGWFATSSSYSSMRRYREQTSGLTPPRDLIDLVCNGLAGALESEALNGYRQRDRAQLTDDVSVVGDRWIAQDVGPFLWQGRMSPAVRERLDVALVLLRHALARGACYLEHDDQIYEDVTRFYSELVPCLHDYRRPQVEALRDGAILLHGGRAEDREEVAREIHLARTGGLDELSGISFVIHGQGQGRFPLPKRKSEATVYIPDPLALSPREQAWLAVRLAPDGPPGPTILGAEDEPSFREQAQSRLLEELVPRLYTFEHDLRLELSRRDSPAR